MKSRTTSQFRKLFANLPEEVKEQTRQAYRQFKKNQNHPSLRFKKVHPQLLDGDTMIWFWVGSHADYDKLLSHL